MGEHIFMVQYEEDIYNRMGFQQLFTPFQSKISSSGDDTGQLFPQLEFVASYDPLDKRIQEKQFYFQNYTLSSNRSDTIEFDPHIYKWHDPVAITETGKSGLNWPLLRYAEALFIYAEAENEISGPIHSAYEAVNEIRRRAEIQELSGLNQEELREAIWKEKLHEMCWENKTWSDMVRLRKAFNPISGEFENFVGHKFVYGPTLSVRELLFPIPDGEIQNNPNITQNPGY
jgi:starch-binding outer membrane protein, SusD/RagB family